MTRSKAASADETTRQRVLRASLELFAEKGFHGTGIRDLANAAGLTTATLYHYMSTKDDLLFGIMEGTIVPLHRAVERIMEELEDPAAALATIIEHHVWGHATDRLACVVTDTEVRALTGERRDRMLKLRDDYERLWRDVVSRGVERACFTAETPRIAARALLQMATGVSHWFSPSGSLSLERLCRLYSDGGLGFLRARAPDGSVLTRADLTLPAPDHYLR